MNAYNKLYKYLRFHGDSVWTFVVAMLMIPIIIGLIVFTAVLISEGLETALSILTEPNFLVIYAVIAIFAVLYALHMKRVRFNIEKVIGKLELFDKVELNDRLEKMTCVNNVFFIDSEYLINFGNGKVTKLTDITYIQSDTQYNFRRPPSYTIRISTIYDGEFAKVYYHSKQKRERLVSVIDMMKDAGMRKMANRRRVNSYEDFPKEANMDEI